MSTINKLNGTIETLAGGYGTRYLQFEIMDRITRKKSRNFVRERPILEERSYALEQLGKV